MLFLTSQLSKASNEHAGFHVHLNFSPNDLKMSYVLFQEELLFKQNLWSGNEDIDIGCSYGHQYVHIWYMAIE
jgi:hypothetical protein